MDTEIKLEKEELSSESITYDTGWTTSDAEHVKCDMAIKTEIKSETPPLEELVKKVKNDNNDDEREYILGVNDELIWMKAETSSACSEIKDEDFPSVKLPRSYTEAVCDVSSSKSTFCTEAEVYSKDLQFEQRNSIPEDKKFNCEICDKRFTLSSSLRRHYFIHTGKQPYKCEICHKKFSRSSYLKCHNSIHEGIKPYKCKICGRSFNRLSHLKYHNLIHEGKKPFKCEICEKRFTSLSDLKKHNLFHEGKRAHKCDNCEKGFNRKVDLKRHVLIHAGIKPYKCDVCEKSFTQLGNYKKHYLRHGDKKRITV